MSAKASFTPDQVSWVNQASSETMGEMVHQAIDIGNVGFIQAVIDAEIFDLHGPSQAFYALQWLGAENPAEREVAQSLLEALGLSPFDAGVVAEACSGALHAIVKDHTRNAAPRLELMERLLALGADPSAHRALGRELDIVASHRAFEGVILGTQRLGRAHSAEALELFTRRRGVQLPALGSRSILDFDTLNDPGVPPGTAHKVFGYLEPVYAALDDSAPVMVRALEYYSRKLRASDAHRATRLGSLRLLALAPLAAGLGDAAFAREIWLGDSSVLCRAVEDPRPMRAHPVLAEIERMELCAEIERVELELLGRQAYGAYRGPGIAVAVLAATEIPDDPERQGVALMARVFRRLLASGVELDSPAGCGLGEYSAIHVAASCGHPGMVDALLEAGVDLECRAPDGRTAQSLAEEFVRPDVLRVIARHRAQRVSEMLREGPMARAKGVRGSSSGRLA